jgi:predicted metal-dependent phosphoesterase TrpH
MRMEMHSHTNYSRGRKITFDGTEPPEAMVRRAKEIGLDAITITDHNTMFGMKEALAAGKKYGITVIPGEEVSSAHGHVTAVGIQETIRPGMSIFETVDLVHAQGGVAVAVHPFDINHDGLRERAKACDAIEIFNGINIDRISNIVARKFADRHDMVGVAGSDAHTASMIGTGTIHTKETDIDAIVHAVKKGRLTVESKYPSVNMLKDFAVRRLQLSYDDTWQYIDENFGTTKKFVAKRLLSTVERSPGNIDKFFSALAYTAFVSSVTYSFWKNGIRG